MIKQALVILLFLICSSVYSQQDKDYRFTTAGDTLIAGTDSIAVDTLSNWGGLHNYVYLISQDTGSTYTDSIVVEGWDTYAQSWITCGMVNMKTNVACTSTNTAPVSPETVAVTAYLINVKFFNIIRQRLINSGAGYVAGRKNISHYYLIQTY